MLRKRETVLLLMVSLLISCFLVGCVAVDTLMKKDDDKYYKPEKTVADYENAGIWWGKKHWNQKLQPNQVDNALVENLVSPTLDYFWVHSDLKHAFVKGYRLGYQERTADLVLGPNLTAAAAYIGKLTAEDFVKTVVTFEEGWAKTVKKAIDVFIALISEGSQADRERFIAEFTVNYKGKYENTQQILKSGMVVTQVSQGGTMLYLDYSKGKTLGALDIPSPDSLKTEIYHQTFKVMGDEWGRRFSTNLIKRDELIDLLRRSKTALEEVEPYLAGNLNIIRNAFINSYGTDAENVFDGLKNAAGYTNVAVNPSVRPSAPKKKK